MQQDLRSFIDNTGFDRAAVARTAELLPTSDAELDACIAEAVDQDDLMAFMLLVSAALSRERPVDARHLTHGAKLLPGAEYLICIVWRLQGDMPEHLLEGMRNTVMHRVCESAALFVIALWCDEFRNGVLPPQVVPRARAMARRMNTSNEDIQPFSFLLALALYKEDSGLRELLYRRFAGAPEEKLRTVEDDCRDLIRNVRAVCHAPVLQVIPEGLVDTYPNPGSVRRAAPQIGRNEPCPCGSGLKYKRCCYEKDRERLRRSSEIEGITRAELNRNPEAHLTAGRLEKMGPLEVVRFGPEKMPRTLLGAYFLRLAAFNLFNRALEAMETLGYEDDLEEAWQFVMFAVVRAGRKEIAERLVELRAPHGFGENDLGLSEKLLLSRDDPGRCIDLIENAALQALETTDVEKLLDIGYAVTFSKFSALGVLLYRGVIPLVSPTQAADCYEQLLIARDRLNVAPDDPIGEVVDSLLGRELHEGKDAAALLDTQEKLDAKRREVRALKEIVERVRKEIARRERADAPNTTLAVTARPDAQTLRDFRDEIERLQTIIREKNDERSALRRELQRARTDLDELRDKSPGAEQDVKRADDEPALLLPADPEERQPVRVIEFPRNFQDSLNGFPRHIARTAMTLLGRLAAGEPEAFSGALRLKACPAVMRQRVGQDYRLLFRVLPDRIQVVDLVPRQDLERRIKSLD